MYRATRLIAVSFAVLAAYVGAESFGDLLGPHAPETSGVGIVLAAVSLLCALLSAVLLVGLGLNAKQGRHRDPPTASRAAALADTCCG